MSKQPNIIYMMTDDQRYDAMGFMGNKQVHTPNLDTLAADGVRFDHAFHVAPICMPSRATVQIGKYVTQHQCGFDLPTNYTITNAEYQNSYPVMMRKAGYYTGFIGKFGFPVTEDKVHNVTRVLNTDSSADDPYYKNINHLDTLQSSLPKAEFDVWNGFAVHGDYRASKDGLMNGYENPWGCDHMTDHMTKQAEAFLEGAKEREQPFVLSISFKAPHRPFDPQARWAEFYKDMVIDRMENDAPEYFEKLPEVVRTHSRNAGEYFGSERMRKESPWLPWKEEENFQRDFKNYYALISGVDEAVGHVREKLKELNLDDNTIIFYTADNGYFCGSKQLGGKELLYEESIKAPMIVYDPRMDFDKQNKWIHGMISHVDICPTILDYAGLEKTPEMFGQSFAPLVDGRELEINDAVYGENDFNNSYASVEEHPHPEKYQSIHSKYVRTKKYKYIRYHLCRPVIEEMWDIANDPLETNNLVSNEAYAEELNKLRGMMDAFIEKTSNHIH
ncbi:MAG: sulfatase-like hydrolase/transferase [Lachnospiraceae bacterium]